MKLCKLTPQPFELMIAWFFLLENCPTHPLGYPDIVPKIFESLWAPSKWPKVQSLIKALKPTGWWNERFAGSQLNIDLLEKEMNRTLGFHHFQVRFKEVFVIYPTHQNQLNHHCILVSEDHLERQSHENAVGVKKNIIAFCQNEIIFHQPRFPWNNSISNSQLHFGLGSCFRSL